MGNVFAKRPLRPVTRPAFIGQPESREDLLPWAAQYNYPVLWFTGDPVLLYPVQGLPSVIQPIKYVIGSSECKYSKKSWENAIPLGKDDMIGGLLRCIKSLSEEELQAMRKTRRV